MSRYFCAVVLEQSPFHPGGGGQIADRGVIAWATGEARVTGFETTDGRTWHLLADQIEPSGKVRVTVRPAW